MKRVLKARTYRLTKDPEETIVFVSVDPSVFLGLPPDLGAQGPNEADAFEEMRIMVVNAVKELQEVLDLLHNFTPGEVIHENH